MYRVPNPHNMYIVCTYMTFQRAYIDKKKKKLKMSCTAVGSVSLHAEQSRSGDR